MNCQTFEPTINDLARGQMMEATVRESALAHAETCERCAARLADERALTFNLRAYASSDSTLEAPALVETALRAAFRQRGATKPAPVIRHARPRTQRWAAWATAAAAAVVTVFALQAFRLREPPAQLDRAGNSVSLSPTAQVDFVPVKPNRSDNSSKFSNGGEPPSVETSGPTVRPALAVNYTAGVNKSSRSQRPASRPQTQPEIVTDFMPLAYGAALSPNEGGQLVRVELPRSALVSMGLPMDVDKSNERVKADVLLGHDGLARAIRFVR